MEDDRPTSVWQETGAVPRQAVAARPSTQQLASSHGAALPSLYDVEPADEVEFITILTPCLQLVAPVGMSEDAQDTWFEAARLALARFPASLLQRGAGHAMMHADHPSKIVPLIVKEIGPALEQRQRIARGRAEPVAAPALPAPGGEMCTPEEVDRICKHFAVGRYSQHRAPRDPSQPTEITTHADPARPCRAPTRDDYLRMGVAPEVLDRIASPPPPDEQRDAA